MENKTEKELIEEQIRKTDEEIERIKAQIEKNNKLIKEGKREIMSNKLKIIKNNFLISWNNVSFFVVFALKIPVYILFLVFITVAVFFNKNLLAMLLNIYHNRYSREELDVIFGYANNLTNHLAFIFYIMLLTFYVYTN